MDRDQLLDLLEAQSGSPLSGEKVSEMFGITRSAVWKQVSQLRKMGYQISGTPNYGYQLEKIPDLLYPREVRRGLLTTTLARQIYHFQRISSTNQVALELARKGYPDGTLVVAEKQNAGRGRWNREWFSPAESGIWFSLILRPPIITNHVPQMTLVTGAACARAIEQQCGVRLGIKWPNDLLYDGNKMGGILLEMEATSEQVYFLVVGVGINVNLQVSDFPLELQQRASSLQIATGQPLKRLPLLRRVLEVLEEDYAAFYRNGFTAVRQNWLDYQVTLDRQVQIRVGGRLIPGRAEELDQEGNLVVLLPDGQTRCFNAGEINFCHTAGAS
jgi:BirA family biotin operon repressor/biotin-[acetyl-CoA-carboxylase] ligase